MPAMLIYYGESVLEGLSLSICLMVPACRQETREYMNFSVPSVCLTLALRRTSTANPTDPKSISPADRLEVRRGIV